MIQPLQFPGLKIEDQFKMVMVANGQQPQPQLQTLMNPYLTNTLSTTATAATAGNQMMLIPVPVLMPLQNCGYQNSYMLQGSDFTNPFSLVQNPFYIQQQQPQQQLLKDQFIIQQPTQFQYAQLVQPSQQQQQPTFLSQYQLIPQQIGMVLDQTPKQEEDFSQVLKDNNIHSDNSQIQHPNSVTQASSKRKSQDESEELISKKVFKEGNSSSTIIGDQKPVVSHKKQQKISNKDLISEQILPDFQNTGHHIIDLGLQDNLILYNRRENWIEKIDNKEISEMTEGIKSSEELFRIASGNEQASQNILERFNHSISQMTVQDLLKQDKAMFHNQSKLYFNYMLKQVVRYLHLTNLPPTLMQKMVNISHNIKNSGRRLDAKQVRKTDFYNHSHYNVCYLTINENSIKKFKERDIELHQQVFSLDLSNGIENVDKSQLEVVNFYKKCLFEIYRRYFSVSNCEIKKQYHSRAVRGIELMINGKFVQRF